MIKKTLRYTFYLLIITITLVLLLDFSIGLKTKPYIYHDYKTLPDKTIGVVLGTSKYVRGGGINVFYKNRIDSAIDLYWLKKIDYLLVSGDNAFMNYNEPITMYRDLIKAGIPSSAITIDYAGFRTLDSIIRANKIFSANDFTIITQEFHCERALFIAQSQGIKAQCFAAPSPEHMKIVRMREVFARAAAVIDIYILNKEPKFLGPITPIINSND